MSTTTETWSMTFASDLLQIDTWQRIDISWMRETGLAFYIDHTFINRVGIPMQRDMEAADPINSDLVIGRAFSAMPGQVFAAFCIDRISVVYTTYESAVRNNIIRPGQLVISLLYYFLCYVLYSESLRSTFINFINICFIFLLQESLAMVSSFSTDIEKVTYFYSINVFFYTKVLKT